MKLMFETVLMLKLLADNGELDNFIEFGKKNEDGSEDEIFMEAIDNDSFKGMCEFVKETPNLFEGCLVRKEAKEEDVDGVDDATAKIIDKLSDVICKCTGCDVTVNSDFEATVELEECNFRIPSMNNALNCYGYIAKDWIITTDGSNVLLCFDLEEL